MGFSWPAYNGKDLGVMPATTAGDAGGSPPVPFSAAARACVPRTTTPTGHTAWHSKEGLVALLRYGRMAVGRGRADNLAVGTLSLYGAIDGMYPAWLCRLALIADVGNLTRACSDAIFGADALTLRPGTLTEPLLAVA